MGLASWLSGKESDCQCRSCNRLGFDPWVGKIPWKRKWNPLQYFCLENPSDRGTWQATVHGVSKELDITEQLNMHRHTHIRVYFSPSVGRQTSTCFC